MGIAHDLAYEFLRPRAIGNECLDVGCRDADWPIWLAQQGFNVTGLDIDEDACTRLQERAIGFNVLAYPGDARALPFGDNVFNCVTAVWCIQHILDDTDILAYQECARVLKPGGRLLLVQSHAQGETRFDYERLDPQRINSTRDVFLRIVQPTGLILCGIESFVYDYYTNIGHYESLERSNAICLHLEKPL